MQWNRAAATFAAVVTWSVVSRILCVRYRRFAAQRRTHAASWPAWCLRVAFVQWQQHDGCGCAHAPVDLICLPAQSCAGAVLACCPPPPCACAPNRRRARKLQCARVFCARKGQWAVSCALAFFHAAFGATAGITVVSSACGVRRRCSRKCLANEDGVICFVCDSTCVVRAALRSRRQIYAQISAHGCFRCCCGTSEPRPLCALISSDTLFLRPLLAHSKMQTHTVLFGALLVALICVHSAQAACDSCTPDSTCTVVTCSSLSVRRD